MAISHNIDPNVPSLRDLKLAGALPITTPTIIWTTGGSANLATAGTDTACASGTIWHTEVFIPFNCTVTGASNLIGSVGGTDKVIYSLHDVDGTLVASTLQAGTTVGTAANFQAALAFITPYAAVAGRYFLGATFNGTTAKLRTYPVPGSAFLAANVAQTFGTSATIAAPTTFTADKGPIGYLTGIVVR